MTRTHFNALSTRIRTRVPLYVYTSVYECVCVCSSCKVGRRKCLLLRLRPGKFYCCTQRRADPLRKTKNDPNSNTRQMSMSQAGQIPISFSLTLSLALFLLPSLALFLRWYNITRNLGIWHAFYFTTSF